MWKNIYKSKHVQEHEVFKVVVGVEHDSFIKARVFLKLKITPKISPCPWNTNLSISYANKYMLGA
jgi:hypothetical protein